MQAAFTGVEKIGEIVTRFPKASDLFKAHQIDFCCGGNRPLAEVVREHSLNEGEILQKLNQMYEEAVSARQEDTDWRTVPSSQLIDHIVETHHAYLQGELPLLSEYVTKILRVHGANHGEVLSKLHRLYHNLKLELDQYLVKEEQIIFPLIKQYEAQQDAGLREKAARVIGELESEHSTAGDLLKEMRAVTDQYTLPDGACRTYMLTFQKLQELESDLFQHIHLENNILFPRVVNN